MCRQKGMHNYIFEIEDIIDNEEDIWVIFKEDKDLIRCQSLADSLWDITYDSNEAVHTY